MVNAENIGVFMNAVEGDSLILNGKTRCVLKTPFGGFSKDPASPSYTASAEVSTADGAGRLHVTRHDDLRGYSASLMAGGCLLDVTSAENGDTAG